MVIHLLLSSLSIKVTLHRINNSLRLTINLKINAIAFLKMAKGSSFNVIHRIIYRFVTFHISALFYPEKGVYTDGRLIMSVMSNALELLNFSRNFFKGSLKSSNKIYSLSYGCERFERKIRRNRNTILAQAFIVQQRAASPTPDKLFDHLSGIAREERIGNCMEYTQVALVRGLIGKIPNIWYVEHMLHCFLLLANTSELYELPLSEFSRFRNRGFYICDPWMNIICPMEDYRAELLLQCVKWGIEGKQILSSGYAEKPSLWASRLLLETMLFEKNSDTYGEPLTIIY